MTRILLIILISIFAQTVFSQVYVEKQSRHRFAQMTLGLDVQSSFGGKTKFVDSYGSVQSTDLPSTYSPRFLIGATHFWGHADFHIAFPVRSQTTNIQNQQIFSVKSVETIFKYYPSRIENNKIRPYVGLSVAPFYHKQTNNNLKFPYGPGLTYTSFPLLAGMTFNSKQHLFELGLSWNYQNKQDYYILKDKVTPIEMAPIFATFSYKFMFETTIVLEKDWESGRTKKVTNALAEEGNLNGFYLGAGISSVFWLKESNYNKNLRPYIKMPNTSIILGDYTLGYYLHKPDLNFAIGYRGYGSWRNTYGTIQRLRRKSLLFEVTKYLFDYHGFVPFIGPAVSYENLSFWENFEDSKFVDAEETKLGYGLTFGWDIRPNRIQSWILRTNLRWYPNLFMKVEPNQKVSFDNLEFNFIQLIIYPNRIIKRKQIRAYKEIEIK